MLSNAKELQNVMVQLLAARYQSETNISLSMTNLEEKSVGYYVIRAE